MKSPLLISIVVPVPRCTCFQSNSWNVFFVLLITSYFFLQIFSQSFLLKLKISKVLWTLVMHQVNIVMFNNENWSNILKKSCNVNTTRFLKYVWQISVIMHGRVKFNTTQLWVMRNWGEIFQKDWSFHLEYG